jgi:hypothetical protein
MTQYKDKMIYNERYRDFDLSEMISRMFNPYSTNVENIVNS